MKILHLSKYYPPYKGGIEDVCYNIVKNISGFKQVVLCFNDHNKNERSTVDGVEIYRVGHFGEVARQPFSFYFFIVLRSYIKRFQPDIIHLHLPNPLICWYVLLLIPRKTKLLVHWHSDIVVNMNLYKMIRPVEKAILKRSDKIIATSPNYQEASEPLKKFTQKIEVIPNVISQEKFRLGESEVTKIKKIQEEYIGRKIVFFMGRHVEYKGITHLIEAYKYVKEDCVVLIAGSGPLTPQLKEMIQSDRIKFLGKISDEMVNIYMRAASVFCFPSITKNEAFGVALAEAMYCKAVPITFTIHGSGVNWVNLKDVTGLEIENGNVKELGKAIDLLLHNDALRNKMADAAYERVMTLFTKQTVIPKLEAIYRSM